MIVDRPNRQEMRVPADAASGGHWLRLTTPLLLIAAWGAVLAGAPAALPIQPASWLTFLALLVAPGYLLGELITWRLKLDSLERLALAFPLSVVVLAVPGMYALLLHLRLPELTAGWQITSALVIAVWLVHLLWQRRPPAGNGTWTVDQWIMLAAIAGAFVAILPTLTIYKIDGDAYAVGSFAADALAGLPLNAYEPLFGTQLGPGVRMTFNQSLPMSYLWSYLAGIDAITLTSTASRSTIALWTLLATYTLGKAVGHSLGGSEQTPRRFGLFLVVIQFAIFLAAPFIRGDNVSIFFFERTTADKFMVPMTMLPVVFAFSMHFLRAGGGRAWLAAAAASFAVSTIHPLIAAMMALALAAFAAFHWLLSLNRRSALWRCVAVGGLVAVVMVLPLVQLYLSRGEAPLAHSYPDSVDGWPVGQKLVPALPFLYVPTMDLYGPLPDLAQIEAIEAESVTNPFLIWRFAVNMNRRRLILFDLDHYISDPNILYEPPYLLALLMLPLLLWRLRRNLGAQFALSTTVAVLFVMFNPLVTPLIGSLVMPWILWRFVWLLPYALIIALGIYRLLGAAFRTGRPRPAMADSASARYAPLIASAAIALLLTPVTLNTLETMRLRAAFPYYYPAPTSIFETLDEQTARQGTATVLAAQDLSVTLPAYVAKANVVAHRMPTTSEIFPANQQVDALQRLIDQENFFRARYLTADAIDILQRTGTDYVVIASGSSLDVQLRLAPQWFEWLQDDQSYSLYRLLERPTLTRAVQGNSALVDRQWILANRHFRAALEEDSHNALAMAGLAEIAHARGQFSQAVNWLHAALDETDQPALHYQLGELYTELGTPELAVAEFESAHLAAPHIARYSLAFGDACLSLGRIDCAGEQFELAVANSSQPDEVSRLVALADLWRQRNQPERALAIYEQVVGRWPSANHKLMLATAYQEAGRYVQAETLLAQVRQRHPFSTEAIALAARVKAEQELYDQAIDLYRQAIRRQEFLAQESTETRLELAETLMNAARMDEAEAEIADVLSFEPNNPIAYSLQGDAYLRQREFDAATQAYQYAFRLNPTQVSVFVKLTNQLRQQGGLQDDILELLQQAIKANPDEPMLTLALGDQLERRGDVDAAIDAYQSALDMFEQHTLPNTLNARANDVSRAYAFARLASVSEDQGQLEAAMNYYNASVAAVPELPWPRVLLGDALRRRGQIEAAEAAYGQALNLDPNHIDGYVRLADLSEALGNQPRAESLREQARQLALAHSADQLVANERIGLSSQYAQSTEQVEIAYASDETLIQDGSTALADSPANQIVDEIVTPSGINLAADTGGDSFRMLAHIYQSTAGPDEAIAFYEQLIDVGEQHGWYATVLSEYHKELGDLYLAQDQATEAMEAYANAVALDDWWPQPRLGLARALADLGQTEVAIEQLHNLVDIAPGYVEAQVALAGALELSGAGDSALTIYEDTASVHAGNANATLALARAHQNRGEWELAENAYLHTLTMNPGNSEAYVGLATLLNNQSRYAEARTLLENALEFDQQNVNAFLQWGVLEQRMGNSDSALEWFNRATDVRVDSPSISIALIDGLVQAGHYEPAMAYIKERLLLQPDDVDLLLRLTNVQRSLGDFSGAIGTLLQAEQREVQDDRLAAALGELYLTQGRPREALAAFQQALNLQPGEPSYYRQVSDIWRSQGDNTHALEVLESGVENAIEPTALYASMAEIYLLLGDDAAAERVLETAMERLGEKSELLIALGAFYEATGSKKVETWYEDLLVNHPNDAGVYVALGDFYQQSGQLEAATGAVQTAIDLNPQDAGQHAVLANLYADIGEVENAIDSYNRALALAPTQIELYSALAALYSEQEMTAKAAETFTRGMSIEPTNGTFLMEYANFLLDEDQPEQAQEILDRADHLAPTAEMLVARAEIRIRLGQDDQAVNDLQTALQKEPGSIEAYIALSDFYQAAGNSRQAQKILESAAEHLVGVSLTRP